jgi:hypothetical protein
LIHGDPFEHLNILEDLFCHHRFRFGSGLAVHGSDAQQTQDPTIFHGRVSFEISP